MEQTAKVTHIFTNGFVEVELEAGGRRAVARDTLKTKRGSTVTVEPEAPAGSPLFAYLPYAGVLILAVLGWLLGRTPTDRLLNALLLGGAAFLAAWIMTRRIRMRRRQEFRVVRLLETPEWD